LKAYESLPESELASDKSDTDMVSDMASPNFGIKA
jgi:hypothetical protein